MPYEFCRAVNGYKILTFSINTIIFAKSTSRFDWLSMIYLSIYLYSLCICNYFKLYNSTSMLLYIYFNTAFKKHLSANDPVRHCIYGPTRPMHSQISNTVKVNTEC